MKKFLMRLMQSGVVLCVLVVGIHIVQGAAPESASSPGIEKGILHTLPPALTYSIQQGRLKLMRTFSAQAGMTGYLVERNGHYGILYGRDGYLFAGELIGPDGSNLTAQYVRQYLPKTDFKNIVHALERNGHLVELGNQSAPVLYIFEDPNCIYCHKLDVLLNPLIQEGKVRVKIALVGFLKPSSMGKATAILTAKDKVSAFEYNEHHFNELTEEGGIKPQTPPLSGWLKIIQVNQELMQKAGLQGTPGILYKNHSGQWIAVDGLPPKARLLEMLKGQ